MASWSLTFREGPKVRRSTHETLAAALDELDHRIEASAPSARRQSVQVLSRRYEPVRQVAARGEIAGPGRLLPSVRGGVDVRGDGSTEAFTGRWRRTLLEGRSGEDALTTLRRTLTDLAG